MLGDGVTLVSSAEETAKDVYRVLYRADLLRPDDAPPPAQIFRATGPAQPFARLSARFLGPELAAAAEVAHRRCRMKLTVLGCSGSLPGPDSPAAGYLVESDGYRVVLDLGNGALGALQRYVRHATSTPSSSRTCMRIIAWT